MPRLVLQTAQWRRARIQFCRPEGALVENLQDLDGNALLPSTPGLAFLTSHGCAASSRLLFEA